MIVFKIPFLLWHFYRYHRGDIVVFNHPFYGILIKKIDWLSDDGKQYSVIGTHPESTDSRQFGFVEFEWLVGKVIFHIQHPSRKRI